MTPRVGYGTPGTRRFRNRTVVIPSTQPLDMVVYAALRDRLLVVREGAEPESSERVGVDGDTLSLFVEGTAVTDVSRGKA